MKSPTCSLVLVLLCTYSCVRDSKTTQVPDLDSFVLSYEPQMVGPNIISKSNFEGHASITPSGDEIYFVVYTNDHSYSTIVYSIFNDGAWSEPEIASFSGRYSDGSPALSPDGNTLFFSSRRPTDQEQDINPSNDIWYVKRNNTEWDSPKRLAQGVNTEFNEFSPSVDRQGNLYFCSNRPGGFGDMDVYYSEYNGGKYQPPVLLDDAINSEYQEGNVGVTPNGEKLFIMVQHKPGDLGYDDIHYSLKTGDQWAPAKNIGPKVNTYSYDFSPKVSPDGKTLFFASRVNRDYTLKDSLYTFKTFNAFLNSPLNGLGNIYKIELSKLNLEQ